MLGDVGDFVKGKLKFLHVWLIFLLVLNSFQWRWHPWKRLDFVLLGVHVWMLGVVNINANDILFLKCDKKNMHHAQPRKDHDSWWLFGKNL